jgi:hypothetical protein
MREILADILIVIGAVLMLDELWMFGVPISPILPDLSAYHFEPIHHWMIGLILVIVGIVALRGIEQE